MVCNGEFLQKDPDEAFDYLDDLAEKSYTWADPSPSEEPRSAEIYQLREKDGLKAHIQSLTKQLEALKTKKGRCIHAIKKVEINERCFICGDL